MLIRSAWLTPPFDLRCWKGLDGQKYGQPQAAEPAAPRSHTGGALPSHTQATGKLKNGNEASQPFPLANNYLPPTKSWNTFSS